MDAQGQKRADAQRKGKWLPTQKLKCTAVPASKSKGLSSNPTTAKQNKTETKNKSY
jgi:hypothetical protein